MGKKSLEPESKIIADQPKLIGKLANKIMLNPDIDKLADSVAEQIGERIMANFATSDLVDKLFPKIPRRTTSEHHGGNYPAALNKWTTRCLR